MLSPAAVRTDLGIGSMPTITISQEGRAQGAAATCRAILERDKDHSPLGVGSHLSVAHDTIAP